MFHGTFPIVFPCQKACAIFLHQSRLPLRVQPPPASQVNLVQTTFFNWSRRMQDLSRQVDFMIGQCVAYSIPCCLSSRGEHAKCKAVFPVSKYYFPDPPCSEACTHIYLTSWYLTSWRCFTGLHTSGQLEQLWPRCFGDWRGSRQWMQHYSAAMLRNVRQRPLLCGICIPKGHPVRLHDLLPQIRHPSSP